MEKKPLNKRDYREISGNLDVFASTMDMLLYPGKAFYYTKKDRRLLEELDSIINRVQDHFWLKSLNKKEKKTLKTPGGII